MKSIHDSFGALDFARQIIKDASSNDAGALDRAVDDLEATIENSDLKMLVEAFNDIFTEKGKYADTIDESYFQSAGPGKIETILKTLAPPK